MIILKDFFSSTVWQDINNRVFTTFGLSGVATVANAIPSTIVTEVATTSILVNLIQVFTLISYIMSIMVACTILFRFILWYKDKDKKNI